MPDASTSSSVDLPQFVGTVFISYARDDNHPPPDKKSSPGWVTYFWHQLRYELTDAGVKATLWLDRHQIDPSEKFTPKIEEALKKAHVIVPVLSPNWVQRPWCRREVERFCKLNGTGAATRIELVVKREPPVDDVPEELQGREGYRFFEADLEGNTVDF